MAPEKQVPTFTNEAEEARWWAEHQDDAEDFFGKPTQAQIDKVTAQLSRLKRNKTPSEAISLRLPIDDLTQAKDLAERKGIGYQTLLKMLIHEGLQREAKQA